MGDRLFDASFGADEDSFSRWSHEADALLADIAASLPADQSPAPAPSSATCNGDANSPSFHAVLITRVIREAKDCLSFEFDTGGVPAFRPLPGQFVTVRVIIGGRPHDRCYAISSLHMRGETPRFTVKRVAGGLVSNWCHDSLKPGRKVLIGPPQGAFQLRRNTQRHVFLAAGIGIAPLFPMIKEAVTYGDRPVMLMLVDRDETCAVFLRALRTLTRQHPDIFSMQETYTHGAGQLSAGDIATHLAGLRDAELYICGPAGFMACAEDGARAAGIASERIRVNHR